MKQNCFGQALEILAFWLAVTAVGVAQSPVKELKVVSFNIRYGTAADGERNLR